jgi:hypothetical protein
LKIESRLVFWCLVGRYANRGIARTDTVAYFGMWGDFRDASLFLPRLPFTTDEIHQYFCVFGARLQRRRSSWIHLFVKGGTAKFSRFGEVSRMSVSRKETVDIPVVCIVQCISQQQQHLHAYPCRLGRHQYGLWNSSPAD